MSEELKAALARIACLEGEIAKRDEELAACRVAVENCEVFRARIAELDRGIAYYKENLDAAYEDRTSLREELAAIKAQEPVAWVGAIEYGVPLLMVEPQNWKATPLYAAPVSEAKAQGVVMDGSQLAGLLEQVRLDDDEAKPHGSGATYWNNAVIACQVAIRDALAAPVQQVSVPDERIIPTSAELIQWAWEEEPEETRFQEGYNAAKRWVKMQIEAGIAAPAAPAADAWIQVSERLPDSGSTVIAYYLSSYGKGRAIRAQHVEAWTIEAEDVADVDTDCVEYSEQDDCYYLLQGWYECIDNWDEYYRVAVTEGPITHWMPLAAAPAQSTTEGQGDE